MQSAVLTESQLSDFAELGFLRLAGAFSLAEAASMQDLVWSELSRLYGIRRSDPTSWSRPRPAGLQRITGAPEFAPIGGPALCGAIDDLLGPGAWQRPKRWGAILVTFPVADRTWGVPSSVWHVDFSYALPPKPLPGVKVFIFVSDVPHRSGGTLVVAGAHRVVEQFVAASPGDKLKSTRRTRLSLLASHPWLRQLTSKVDAEDRVTRFMEAQDRIGDVPVRVTELTGSAGDVVLTHPWLLHCAAQNGGDGPRLMRTQDIYRLSGGSLATPTIGEGATASANARAT